MEIFRDTFEGTEFDMVKNLTVTGEEGKHGDLKDWR